MLSSRLCRNNGRFGHHVVINPLPCRFVLCTCIISPSQTRYYTTTTNNTQSSQPPPPAARSTSHPTTAPRQSLTSQKDALVPNRIDSQVLGRISKTWREETIWLTGHEYSLLKYQLHRDSHYKEKIAPYLEAHRTTLYCLLLKGKKKSTRIDDLSHKKLHERTKNPAYVIELKFVENKDASSEGNKNTNTSNSNNKNRNERRKTNNDNIATQMDVNDYCTFILKCNQYLNRNVTIDPDTLEARQVLYSIFKSMKKNESHGGGLHAFELIFHLKMNGVIVPNAVINNMKSAYLNPETWKQVYLKENDGSGFKYHPIAWLINNFYFNLYIDNTNSVGLVKDPFQKIFRFHYTDAAATKIDDKTFKQNLTLLVQKSSVNGIPLDHVIREYRKKFGSFKFENDSLRPLNQILRECDLFTAQTATTTSQFILFKNYQTFSTHVRRYIDNKYYSPQSESCGSPISLKELYAKFQMPSFKVFSQLFEEFDFTSEFDPNNGETIIYCKPRIDVSKRGHYNLQERKKMQKSSNMSMEEFNSNFNSLLEAKNGIIFLSQLNDQFYEHCGKYMPFNVNISTAVKQRKLTTVLPWVYRYCDEKNSTIDDISYLARFSERIIADTSLTQKHEFERKLVYLANLLQIFSTRSTNELELGTLHKTLHLYLNENSSMTQKKYWQEFIKIEDKKHNTKNTKKKTQIASLDHDSILKFWNKVQVQLGISPSASTIVAQDALVSQKSIDDMNQPKDDIDALRTDIASIKKLLVHMIEERQPTSSNMITAGSKNTGNIKIGGDMKNNTNLISGSSTSKMKLDNMGKVGYGNQAKKIPFFHESSLATFGENTLKSMLMDCIQMNHFKSAMDIFNFLTKNNIHCDMEHCLGLIKLATFHNENEFINNLWNDMIDRHFSKNDTFRITTDTFHQLNYFFKTEHFESLMIPYVDAVNQLQLNTNADATINANINANTKSKQAQSNLLQYSQEILLIFLKYVQESQNQALAQWFRDVCKIDDNNHNGANFDAFENKAGLMNAVTMAKDGDIPAEECNASLTKYLSPWCDNLSELSAKYTSHLKRNGKFGHSNTNSKIAMDVRFLQHQIDTLISRSRTLSHQLSMENLERILQLYALCHYHESEASHIVHQHLQQLCLAVFHRYMQEDDSNRLTEDFCTLLTNCGLNSDLFVKLDNDEKFDLNYFDTLQLHGSSQNNAMQNVEISSQIMDKQILTSYVNGSKNIKSFMENLDRIGMHMRKLAQIHADTNNDNVRKNAIVSRVGISLKKSMNGFLRVCGDVDFALMVLEKILNHDFGCQHVHLGYFHRVLEIGIESGQQQQQQPLYSSWNHIKHVFDLFLSRTNYSVNSMETFNKLIEYCVVYNDIHGLTDTLQIFSDFVALNVNDGNKDLFKISKSLFADLIEMVCNKSGEAGIQLFKTLTRSDCIQLPLDNDRTFYYLLKPFATQGNIDGVNAIKNLMYDYDYNNWDVNIYNLLIECNAINGLLSDSINLRSEMDSKQIMPTIDTFNAILSHADIQKDASRKESETMTVDFMLDQLNEMSNYKINPTNETFSIILNFIQSKRDPNISHIAKQIFSMTDTNPNATVLLDTGLIANYLGCFYTIDDIATQTNNCVALVSKFNANKNDGNISLLSNDVINVICNRVYYSDCDDSTVMPHGESKVRISFDSLTEKLSTIVEILKQISQDSMDIMQHNDSIDIDAFRDIFEIFTNFDVEFDDANVDNVMQISQSFWNILSTMTSLGIIGDESILHAFLRCEKIKIDILKRLMDDDENSFNVYNDRLSAVYGVITDGIGILKQSGIMISANIVENACTECEFDDESMNQVLNRFQYKLESDRNLRISTPLPVF